MYSVHKWQQLKDVVAQQVNRIQVVIQIIHLDAGVTTAHTSQKLMQMVQHNIVFKQIHIDQQT